MFKSESILAKLISGGYATLVILTWNFGPVIYLTTVFAYCYVLEFLWGELNMDCLDGSESSLRFE